MRSAFGYFQGGPMKNQFIENEVRYQIAKTVLLTMLKDGDITREEYELMKKRLLERYQPFIEILNEDDIWEKKE